MTDCIEPKALETITRTDYCPVSLQEVRDYLRVDHNEDDAEIDALIEAATEHVESYLRRSLLTTGYRAWFSGFATLVLPKPPLLAVTAVKYINTSDTTTTVDPSIYRIEPTLEPGVITLALDQSWPSDVETRLDMPVSVEYEGGYGNGYNAVPGRVKAAIKKIVSELYENREETAVGQGVTVV